MTPEDKALAHFLAERLMGWWLLNTRHPRWTDATGKYMEHVDAWNPANRDDHAMMVLEALNLRLGKPHVVTLRSSDGLDASPTWCCRVQAGHLGPVLVEVENDSPCRAIAEAAKAALEGEGG